MSPKSRNLSIFLLVALVLTFYSAHKATENKETLKIFIDIGDPANATNTPTTFNRAPIACVDLSVADFGNEAALALSSINWPYDSFVLRGKNGFDAGYLKKIIPGSFGDPGCYLELFFGGVKEFSQPLDLISKNGYVWPLSPAQLKWKEVSVVGDGASM